MMPLAIAIAVGSTVIVRLLAEAGARLEDEVHRQITPLGLAVVEDRFEIFRILLSFGADPTLFGRNDRPLELLIDRHGPSEPGETPDEFWQLYANQTLLWAARGANLTGSVEEMRTALLNKGDVNARDMIDLSQRGAVRLQQRTAPQYRPLACLSMGPAAFFVRRSAVGQPCSTSRPMATRRRLAGSATGSARPHAPPPNKDLCTRKHASSKWLVRVMARLG